jgi:phosphocarrier protein HPr
MDSEQDSGCPIVLLYVPKERTVHWLRNGYMIKTLEFGYPSGLHARPSVELSKIVNQFDAEVFVIHEGTKASAKSILDVLCLGVQPGTITIEAEGNEAEKAMQAVEQFIYKLNTKLKW